MTIGYCTVTLEWDGPGSPGTNTWHLRTTGSDFAAATEPEDLMGLVEDFYVTAGPVLRNGLVVHWDGEYHGLGTDLGDSKSFTPWTFTNGGTGADAADGLAVVIGWRTGSGGRRGKGRTFLGPLAQQAFDANGELAELFVSSAEDAAEALVTASQGFGNGAIGVYSRLDAVVRDVTSSVTSRTYGMLRSRRD